MKVASLWLCLEQSIGNGGVDAWPSDLGSWFTPQASQIPPSPRPTFGVGVGLLGKVVRVLPDLTLRRPSENVECSVRASTR